jgi:helix-turn-helix protein
MSEGEQKLVDTSGDYRYAVKDGETVDGADWRSCRVLLTTERLILSTGDGRQAIPHSKIRLLDSDDSIIPDQHAGGTASPLRIGNNVILIDTQELDDFQQEYCRAAIQDKVILAKHPAIVGGVVQDEATWSKARFRLRNGEIMLGLPEGKTVSITIDNVGTIETAAEQVMDESRKVVRVEHTDEEGRSVETHFSGGEWHTAALAQLLRNTIEDRQDEYELDDVESQVLMALYSGVSPFEMADFVGIEVDEVEEIYQKLLAVGAVDKVRERTEVSLNAKGRNLASEAMNEQ